MFTLEDALMVIGELTMEKRILEQQILKLQMKMESGEVTPLYAPERAVQHEDS